MVTHTLKTCRMIWYNIWNITFLVMLFTYSIPAFDGYSCERGSYLRSCNCKDDTGNCNNIVEHDESIELHCCLNTSSTISWYKENISSENLIGFNEITSNNYSASATGIDEFLIGTQIFDFKNGGQTLLIWQALVSLAGTYICKSGERSFRQYLDVQGTDSRDPKLNVESDESECPTEVKGHPNEEVTLCCKFRSTSRAVPIFIQWFANSSNTVSLLSNYKIMSECSVSQDERHVNTIVQTTLNLKISHSSYGQYGANVTVETYDNKQNISNQCLLSLTKQEEQDRHGLTVIIFCVIGLIIFCAVVYMLIFFCCIYYRYNVPINLFYSYHCRPVNDTESKSYDAFIAYSNADNDVDFVVNILRPFFNSNNFSVCIRDINFLGGGGRFDDSTAAVKASRRTILILSPEFISSPQCRFEFDIAFDDMIDMGKGHVIPILLPNFPKNIKREHKKLKRVLFFAEKLHWVESESDVFLKKLLKRMPSKGVEFANQNSRFYSPNYA